jgi:hypothetical protein
LAGRRRKERKAVEPESIFLQAVAFHHAQLTLMLAHPHNRIARAALAPAICVLSAFTSELLLKCLICIEKGYMPYTPDGHDLLVLFEMLSIRTRERLKKMWADHYREHPVEEFQNNLGFPFETDLLLALGMAKTPSI